MPSCCTWMPASSTGTEPTQITKAHNQLILSLRYIPLLPGRGGAVWTEYVSRQILRVGVLMPQSLRM